MFDIESFKEHLAELLAIKSENGTKGVTKAIKYMLETGNSMGFVTKDLDGIAGYIEMGDDDLEKTLGIVVHVDTVGVDDNWTSDPFIMAERDGNLYARGIIDDKGPALLILYVMNELAKLEAIGVKPDMKIRLIIGGDEESGNNLCMTRYKLTEKEPDMSFSPDANFPVVYGEKGILRIKIFSEKGIDGFTMQGGDRINVVPSFAKATINGKEYTANGEAAHASTPELGDNAILKLGKMLQIEKVDNNLVKLLNICDVNGLNIALKDSESALTINPATINADENGIALMCDIRYNIFADVNDILQRIKNAVSPFGFDASIEMDLAPLYVDKNSDFIKKLSNAYSYVTGDMTKPMVIGGGTYAREFKNCVAFGPEFPNEDNVCHIPDEYWSITRIKQCFSIYFEAIKSIAFDNNDK